MAKAASDIEAECWVFAVALYARSGVAEACLRLQDAGGVDVMLMLAVVFAAARHRVLLSRDEIVALDAACRPWREEIVQPLRTVRARLKQGPPPAPGEATEPFRSSIKAVELAAEKLQNKLLAEHLPLKSPAASAVTREQLHMIVGYLVEIFVERRGGRAEANLSVPVVAIVEAALQEAC